LDRVGPPINKCFWALWSSLVRCGERYQVSFRGSTVVDIEPRDTVPELIQLYGPELIPLYQRSHFSAKQSPLQTVRRFVADKILPLQ
jgi:hypothetical protein